MVQPKRIKHQYCTVLARQKKCFSNSQAKSVGMGEWKIVGLEDWSFVPAFSL